MSNPTAFANRLQKMSKHYDKWARRQGISCYRVYDADLPDYPVAIDRYERYIHAAEYTRAHGMSPEEHRGWRAECRQVMAEVFGVSPLHIFFKTRERQSGTQQYEKVAERTEEHVVQEGGLKFWVNLSDYLDTGLFLDHRITRAMVRERSAGKAVLNLFAYTGSFTVYAAAGGAERTTSIDLSNTYLAWAERNLQLNELAGPQHEFVRADIKEWLRQEAAADYDLIVLDPPTFSNSKAMRNVLDVQQDHAYLINHCLRRLRPGGTIFFSTNYRKFELNAADIRSSAIKNITAQTIPPDFANKKIHYAWEISRPMG